MTKVIKKFKFTKITIFSQIYNFGKRICLMLHINRIKQNSDQYSFFLGIADAMYGLFTVQNC